MRKARLLKELKAASAFTTVSGLRVHTVGRGRVKLALLLKRIKTGAARPLSLRLPLGPSQCCVAPLGTVLVVASGRVRRAPAVHHAEFRAGC